MKKIATLILVLTMLLLLGLTRAAADMWSFHLPAELTEIEEAAFQGDTSLDGVYVDDNIQTIGPKAFADSSLRYIRLPEGLTEFAPDAFLNVPHVEVYGTWNEDFFAGMDNVSRSGAELDVNNSSCVPLAPGQEAWRTIPVTMTGKWYVEVQNCVEAALYDSNGEKISDLVKGEYSYFFYDTISEKGNYLLWVRNNTDALTEVQVRVDSPFLVTNYLCKYQAEHKFGASMLVLYEKQRSFALDDLEPHYYFAPAIETKFDGNSDQYTIDLYVDDIAIQHWEGTFLAGTDAEHYFTLEPEDVMKFSGFEAGAHTVRVVANGETYEYTYTLTGECGRQPLGPKVTSLYLLPDVHAWATFTAPSDGVYTFRSDIPYTMQIFARLYDTDQNLLDSKLEPNEEYDFLLTAELAEGQTVVLEIWLDAQPEAEKPFYGVVPLIVNSPSADGYDIFRENTQYRALVIGQTYENAVEGITKLSGCKNDANSMTAMLSSLPKTPYTVTTCMDLEGQEILDAIPAAFAGATENDISLFYYTGHGATGSGSLVGIDNVNVTPATLKATLDKIPGTKIILLDSCFSGYLIGRGEEDGVAEAMNQFLSVFSLTSRGEGSDYYILTASSKFETSIGYVESCSLFTRNLLGGMGYSTADGSRTGTAPADANHDGMFTLNELFYYCRYKVRNAFVGQTVCPMPYNCDQVLFFDVTPEE